MDLTSWLLAVVLTIFGCTAISSRRVSHRNEAIVERFGRYHRKLMPGLNFGIIPFIDEVVREAETREQLREIEVKDAITSDGIFLKIDVLFFWRSIDLYSAFYEIDNVQDAIEKLIIVMLRSSLSEMPLQKVYSQSLHPF